MPSRGVIRVLAGPNGAGKSSVGGVALQQGGAVYYNPDHVTALLLSTGAMSAREEANSLAWHRCVEQLTRAIERKSDFTFETTLGGTTIPRLLARAADEGLEVHVWFVALDSADLHVQRVRERVAAGGHDIPEQKIRARYTTSPLNLARLLPKLASVAVFDNSAPPDDEGVVEPRLLLRMRNGIVVTSVHPSDAPAWSQPILAAATGR
jgi:predicted ABC-type ATPase